MKINNRKIQKILAVIVLVLLGILYLKQNLNPAPSPSPSPTPSVQPSAEPSTEDVVYTMKDVKALKNTQHFLDSTIEHIFCGTINSKGNATGYHYDGIQDTPGQIVEGTRSEKDRYGVYTAKVTVDGIAKSGNKGYSTFYPEEWSPQDVIDAINQAYANKELLNGNLYAGLTDEGIEIDMALTDDGLIITAYPVMED